MATIQRKNGVNFDTSLIKKLVASSRDLALKAVADQVAHRLDDYIDRVSRGSLNRRVAMAQAGFSPPNSILNNPFQDLKVKVVKQSNGSYTVMVEDSHSENQARNVFNILDRGRASIQSQTMMIFPVYDVARTIENSLELYENRLVHNSRTGKLLFAKVHYVKELEARNLYNTAAREVLEGDLEAILPKRDDKGRFLIRFKKSDIKIKMVK